MRLSDVAAIKYQLVILVIGTLRSAREITTSSSKLWLQGHFLLASIGIRALLELNGQLLWAEKKVLAPLIEGAIDLPSERVRKLLLGSKSAVPLGFGEVGPHPLINVMEYVRAAEAVRLGAVRDYDSVRHCPPQLHDADLDVVRRPRPRQLDQPDLCRRPGS